VCIIVDANCGSEFSPVGSDAAPIYNWVMKSNGQIAIGGTLKRELLGCKFRDIYQTLLLAGRIREFDGGAVDQLAAEYAKDQRLKSDDPHIIALAHLSNARLLFSRDRNLHRDFTSAKLLPAPRGKVYQRNCRAHVRLLKDAPACC
jgi:hypothetical protein